ncbi:beta-ketoacyl synthase N-terminal-like domain-containing protein [Aliikangiella maris]|uniref:Type I polyketide synthase n=2 Tax=Aliikangiella maris TaxID=3162458 RepID=A0ABV2BZN3_9GAMM
MGALADYDCFDPLFFNISPVEAESIDPQQRLFLQNCWHAIEDAGYNPRELSDSLCGVFVGCGAGDYQQFSISQQLSAQGFTGNSASILAARIAYFLNLQGPCLSIDTACSSSLVAIANACDSLQVGSSDLALAGGVYIMSGPSMHIKTAQSGMLSQDGRCFTFDQRANGFVPGEAVGVVLLKRLADAVEAQDNIYGVVEGWGMNQDGKSNGITAPNARAQTKLITSVYEKFSIDPAQIQLIEAHGTGTKLGDPIEVDALKDAFNNKLKNQNQNQNQNQGQDQNTQYCAIGSVKSNIGHCVSAAGVAGVIKVALALKHQQLPPTINFENLNEHIRLENSPFYISEQLKPWSIAQGQTRRAAVSSFGFSGTNAHLVIREWHTNEYVTSNATYSSSYSAAGQSQTTIDNKASEAEHYLIVLSARTNKQLLQQVNNLGDFINAESSPVNMAALSYTLQVGRAAMQYRWATLVANQQQLITNLKYFTKQQATKIDPLEQQRTNYFYWANIEEPEYLQEQNDWLHDSFLLAPKDTLLELARNWCTGKNVDWSIIQQTTPLRRLHLPHYPFDKQRYWAESDDNPLLQTMQIGREQVGNNWIHPLLHENISDLQRQCYRTVFSGNELFLRDHQIQLAKADTQLKPILPGVAYLEMIRAAIENAANNLYQNKQFQLTQVAWVRPLVVDVNRSIEIVLLPQSELIIDVEVYAYVDDELQKNLLLMQCRVAFNEENNQESDSQLIDWQGIENSLSQAVDAQLFQANEIYAYFQTMGLHYGDSHQAIQQLIVSQQQLVARLEVPGSLAQEVAEYQWHPGMLDSVLQTTVGFLMQQSQAENYPHLPFSLEKLSVYRTCRGAMFVRVKQHDIHKNETQAQPVKVKKYDLELFDADGQRCIKIEGFSTRLLSPQQSPSIEFDDTHYQQIIERVINHKISVEDAVELG